MALAKIRIEPIEGRPLHYNIFLEDVDISRFVRHIAFSIGANQAPTVQLTINPILLPTEFDAVIKAEYFDPEKIPEKFEFECGQKRVCQIGRRSIR